MTGPSTDATSADKTFTVWEVERHDCCAAPGGFLRCLTGFFCPACLYGQGACQAWRPCCLHIHL